ncbi:MAG: 2-phospho-L-lactate transferase [Gammaproteobacteria bacterium]|nr:2-phospho-L-lactate transferase [Gammaproteobacteria bacterium]
MPKILAITGGVGGAKLALGLSQLLGPEQLVFAVNTADDFEHLGLHISPDIDSLTYALAQQNNQDLGWGRQGETWQFIETLASLGGEDWFRLGDKDMALHVRRTQLLASGNSLTQATQSLTQAMGILHRVLPMSNDPVRTLVHTNQGVLPFQEYFVKERCQPKVIDFEFQGIENAQLNPDLAAWLAQCDAVVICPSNPYVSVDPLLKLAGFKALLAPLPVVAISPIVGGLAIKGPAAKMMKELNIPASAAAVAKHYDGLIDGFIVDKSDENDSKQIEIPSIVTNTIMVTLQDRVSLAKDTLRFLRETFFVKGL